MPAHCAIGRHGFVMPAVSCTACRRRLRAPAPPSLWFPATPTIATSRRHALWRCQGPRYRRVPVTPLTPLGGPLTHRGDVKQKQLPPPPRCRIPPGAPVFVVHPRGVARIPPHRHPCSQYAGEARGERDTHTGRGGVKTRGTSWAADLTGWPASSRGLKSAAGWPILCPRYRTGPGVPPSIGKLWRTRQGRAAAFPVSPSCDCDLSAEQNADEDSFASHILDGQGRSLGGGTQREPRHTLSERALGLPQEPGPDRFAPFRQLPRNGANHEPSDPPSTGHARTGRL